MKPIQQVLIIRHAEKTADKEDEKLSVKGRERAAALAYFMPDKYGTIDFIFAAGVGHGSKSHRPEETVKPLAEQLGLKTNTNYLKDDYPQMVQDILADDTYAGKVIVIAWQHTMIEDICNLFKVTNTPTAPWPSSCFDLVWNITWVADGTCSVVQEPQLLLYGDTAAVVG